MIPPIMISKITTSKDRSTQLGGKYGVGREGCSVIIMVSMGWLKRVKYGVVLKSVKIGVVVY